MAPAPSLSFWSKYLVEFGLNSIKQYYTAVMGSLWLKFEAHSVPQDQAEGVLGHGAKVHEPEHGLDQISSNLPKVLHILLG